MFNEYTYCNKQHKFTRLLHRDQYDYIITKN